MRAGKKALGVLLVLCSLAYFAQAVLVLYGILPSTSVVIVAFVVAGIWLARLGIRLLLGSEDK